MIDSSLPNQQSQRINDDMKLLKQFSQSSVDHRISGPGQMGQLAQILKARNSKFKYSQQAKASTQQWVKDKGSDISPLVTKIRNLKNKQAKQQIKKSTEADCYFYINDLSFSNQKQYIRKNFQFGIFSAMQSTMSHQNYRPSLAMRIFQDRKQKGKTNRNVVDIPVLNVQTRNKAKKNSYKSGTKTIMDNLSNQKSLYSNQWSQVYQKQVREYFWSILEKQCSKAREAKGNQFVAMCIASIKILQGQYNQELPSSYQNIQYYLNNKYLNKMNGQYQREGTFGAVWGISYLLYQAGRKSDFYQFLRDEVLRQAFKQLDKAIDQLKPVKSDVGQQNSDVFHDQLVYTLKGMPKFADQALCDTSTCDVAWIFLRNVGIFGDKTKFQELRTQLYESYQGPFIAETKIKNLLFLMGYTEIAQIGPNDIMDQDDFLHFLITVYYTPQLNNSFKQNRKKIIEKRLTQQLINYIHEFLLQDDNTYKYYMMLIPNNLLANQASSIIASSKLLQKIDWGFFKNHLHSNLYEQLVNQTLSKHVSFYHQYKLAAQKHCKLLTHNDKAVQFLLQMNINAMLQHQVSQKQLENAQQLFKNILYKNQVLKRQYYPVFSLFQQNRKLCKLIAERNQNKIHQYLRICDHLLITENLRIQTKKALDKLVARGGFQCYIMYIRNTIKASQIALIKLNKISDLRDVLNLTWSALKSLLHTQPYASVADKSSAKDLENMLEQLLYRTQ